MTSPLATLLGDDQVVPVADGTSRRYLSFDAGASTASLPQVALAVTDFLPRYSSVHRGAGWKSQAATAAYEEARAAALAFAGDRTDEDVAIFCRNTTDAINHLSYRLQLDRSDVVATTVVEHHANLLPWSRVAQTRHVDVGREGTFAVDDVISVLEQQPRPKVLAVTAASNVTGWIPPIGEIIQAAHDRGVEVALDAAQLAPHRPIPPEADYVAWSGHKMYAPFGVGVLAGKRSTFTTGDPFLHGGGAVAMVALDEVAWAEPPEREEAGSPNVVGAVALHAAIDTLSTIGWDAITGHEAQLGTKLRSGLAGIPGVQLLGPPLDIPTLAVAAFNVSGQHHALVAARLATEFGIGVRHGCFCAHPYLGRLLGLDESQWARFRAEVLEGDRSRVPGAVRASCGISTSLEDVDNLLAAVRTISEDGPGPVEYTQDRCTGDFLPNDPALRPGPATSDGPIRPCNA
ncbi:MAG TPA: aminotransferase class V-fold PLP-dependent enzyme [Acidimicrobiales bacterium]|nr:aminotransferase class V-fold PLP-dependent enzyme [Acidimicrobiales bacterium]